VFAQALLSIDFRAQNNFPIDMAVNRADNQCWKDRGDRLSSEKAEGLQLASAPGSVTRIIADMDANAPDALARLFEVLYRDLRRMARLRLRSDAAAFDVSPTSLVHDAYERLVAVDQLRVADREHFFRYAANVMRSVIVDLARSRMAVRHGGEYIEIPIDTMLAENLSRPLDENVVRLHDALTQLETIDPRIAKVVELRFFGGLSVEETASALGLTDRTIKRDWQKARSLLSAMITAI
jgi:RNA polymerase sigma factor (TIGR02999 family)